MCPQVTWETRKIFGFQHMDISCTAVRVPTLRAHAEAITLETVLQVHPDDVR
jgi:aspartate-semialdehyde dehydrogenase